MNRENIIVMADASGLSLYGMGKDREQFIDYLERFAALVASAEREACAKVCDDKKRYWHGQHTPPPSEQGDKHELHSFCTCARCRY